MSYAAVSCCEAGNKMALHIAHAQQHCAPLDMVEQQNSVLLGQVSMPGYHLHVQEAIMNCMHQQHANKVELLIQALKPAASGNKQQGS